MERGSSPICDNLPIISLMERPNSGIRAGEIQDSIVSSLFPPCLMPFISAKSLTNVKTKLEIIRQGWKRVEREEYEKGNKGGDKNICAFHT
ncbi:unnamed protein product [Sphenostylis stenocarpa]|uniref:Uncharacterized protein n=1 Tax=Sphenostylis stenocarpa TaxID=92480 RepID=A0AA86SEM7_9FABA|nr:unnamed protein product [Sphenostylis stenocarpa]